jgi:hypothetical protein
MNSHQKFLQSILMDYINAGNMELVQYICQIIKEYGYSIQIVKED